jgi:hypothetical protein
MKTSILIILFTAGITTVRGIQEKCHCINHPKDDAIIRIYTLKNSGCLIPFYF